MGLAFLVFGAALVSTGIAFRRRAGVTARRRAGVVILGAGFVAIGLWAESDGTDFLPHIAGYVILTFAGVLLVRSGTGRARWAIALCFALGLLLEVGAHWAAGATPSWGYWKYGWGRNLVSGACLFTAVAILLLPVLAGAWRGPAPGGAVRPRRWLAIMALAFYGAALFTAYGKLFLTFADKGRTRLQEPIEISGPALREQLGLLVIILPGLGIALILWNLWVAARPRPAFDLKAVTKPPEKTPFYFLREEGEGR